MLSFSGLLIGFGLDSDMALMLLLVPVKVVEKEADLWENPGQWAHFVQGKPEKSTSNWKVDEI